MAEKFLTLDLKEILRATAQIGHQYFDAVDVLGEAEAKRKLLASFAGAVNVMANAFGVDAVVELLANASKELRECYDQGKHTSVLLHENGGFSELSGSVDEKTRKH